MMTTHRIIAVICLPVLILSAGHALPSGFFPDLFINEISDKSIKILCSDQGFLEQSKTDTSDTCIETLVSYRIKCDGLVKPLVPRAISGKYKDRDNDLKQVAKLKYLGELYYMCMIAATFQNIQ